MKLLKVLTLGVTTAIIASTATAKVESKLPIPVVVGAEVGTMGLGVNAGWIVNEHATLKGGFTGLKFSGDRDFEIQDGNKANANVDFKLANPYFGVQVRPMQNGLTVTSGLMAVKKTPLQVTATPKKDASVKVEIEDKDYTLATQESKLDLDLSVKKTAAPYLTVGYHSADNKKLGFFGEIGAVYVKGFEPKARLAGSLKAENGMTFDENSAEFKDLETKLNKELKKEYEDNAKSYDKFYPMIKVGVEYKF